MKKIICLLLSVLLLLCVGCAQQSDEQPTEPPTENPTTEPVTVAPELLPSVFEDASEFVASGNIEISAPQGATEVSQIILYDEVSQVQFMFNDVLYTYRAAFASTGREGYALTGIFGETEYLEDEIFYTNDSVDYAIEAHLLSNGAILLWMDNEINYSLSSYGGTFEDLSAVADLIFEN